MLKEQGATGKEEGGNNLLPKEMGKAPFVKHVVKNLSIIFYINLFALASIEFLCIVNTSFFILKVLDELTMAKNNYIALNSQLLEELPRLSKKCLQFFHFCLSNFVKARFRYFTEISDELTVSLQVLLHQLFLKPSSILVLDQDIISQSIISRKLDASFICVVPV